MFILTRLYTWYGKRVVLGVLGALALLIIAGVALQVFRKDAAVAPLSTNDAKSVTVARVGDMAAGSSFRVVGTVEAVSEAKLQTEASGRITNVAVKLGDWVAAGTVIASIENSRERASLLQAEGMYDAVTAQSAQSEVGLDEARVGVENVYRKAFTTSEVAMNNLVDELFSDATSQISGFRLDANGRTLELVNTRRELRAMLAAWSADVAGNFALASPESLLRTAEQNTILINDFVTELAQIVVAQDPTTAFPEATLSSYESRFENTRGALNAMLADISHARSAYEQAALSASGMTTSLSDAQLKSALGSLRAAQANYEKTLVRTPIAGTVNALYLKAGEFVGPNAPAALIANNGALEIKTAVSEEDSALLHVGDTVSIDRKATGTIARIAPGIDPLTGKIEVRITITDALGLKNGSTVGISFSEQEEVAGADITVPIVAIKMLPSSPVVFSMNDEQKLVAHPVVLGEVRGSVVVVSEGLTRDMEIISDARGMQAGETVEVIHE